MKDVSIRKEKMLASTISVFLGNLSASIPVIGSSGAKVKLRTASTPAIANGELSEASPASMNMARTVNQSPMYRIMFDPHRRPNVLFDRRSSTYPGLVTGTAGHRCYHCHPRANMNKWGFPTEGL